MTPPRHSALRRAALKAVATSIAGAALTACGMFNTSKDKKKLEGERISVLALERELRPNVESVDTQVILPHPEDAVDWPQSGGLSHHAMQHMVISDNPKLVWQASIGAASSKRNRDLAAPIVGGGRVYTIDAKGRVTAFDAKSGQHLWNVLTPPKRERDGAFLGGGLAFEEDRLFVTGGFAEILALSAANGKVLWRVPLESPIHSAPTVLGGRVFAVTLENQAFAVAASTGKVLWTYAGAADQTVLLGGPAPAVDGGVAVTAFSSGEIAALRVDTGTPLWSDSVISVRRTEAAANMPDVAANPVIDRGRVYAVGHSGILVAIDLRTGQRVWDAPIAGVCEPWIAGDFLFSLTLDAELACIDVRSGHIVWVTQIQRFRNEKDKTGAIFWSGPCLASDRLIVVGSNGVAVSVSPYTGEVLSRIKLAAPATLPPVFANKTMYLLNDAGQLTAYR